MHLIRTLPPISACDLVQPTVQRRGPKSPHTANLNCGNDATTRFDSQCLGMNSQELRGFGDIQQRFKSAIIFVWLRSFPFVVDNCGRMVWFNSVAGILTVLYDRARRIQGKAQAMHSWRVWVLAQVGLGIADFHSGPKENGIDIVSGHMYSVNMFRYNW